MEVKTMNKDNKSLGLALRICIILTWVMSHISLFAILSGLENVESEGLDKDNVGERLLKVISDFAGKTTLYYVTFGMLFVCLALAIISRYKTRIYSFIFKIIALVIALLSMASGLEYIGAVRSCKDLSNLVITGTSKEAIQNALVSANFSGDAAKIAETLSNKEEASLALAGYIFPIFILFILTITSIHCLVKKKDPNNTSSANE
jgi:low affinity Fe/Cu permease